MVSVSTVARLGSAGVKLCSGTLGDAMGGSVWLSSGAERSRCRVCAGAGGVVISDREVAAGEGCGTTVALAGETLRNGDSDLVSCNGVVVMDAAAGLGGQVQRLDAGCSGCAGREAGGDDAEEGPFDVTIGLAGALVLREPVGSVEKRCAIDPADPTRLWPLVVGLVLEPPSDMDTEDGGAAEEPPKDTPSTEEAGEPG